MKKIWKIFVGVIFLAVCSGCGIKKEQKKTIEDTKEKIYRECEMLAEGYRNIYENAVQRVSTAVARPSQWMPDTAFVGSS